MYAIRVFAEQSRKHDIRPIWGALVDAADGEVVVRMQNRCGDENLCGILTARYDFSLRQEEAGAFLTPRKTPRWSSGYLVANPEKTTIRLAPLLPKRQKGFLVLTPSVSLADALVSHVETGRLWLKWLRPSLPHLEAERAEAARRICGHARSRQSDLADGRSLCV